MFHNVSIIGHRGCAVEQPENTLEAIEGVSRIVDAVEIDVRRCGSGELVAFHDETLERATGASGRVSDHSIDALRELNVGNSGATIPTIPEMVEATPSAVGLIFDVKESGLVADLLSCLEGREGRVMISAFDRRVLEETRRLDEDIRLAHIVTESRPNRTLRPIIPGLPRSLYAPENTVAMVETAIDLGCEAIHPRYELCLQTDLVEQAHDRDLQVNAWTVCNVREGRALARAGVDGLIADVCEGLVEQRP